MIKIESLEDGKIFSITLIDKEGMEQELNLTKDEMNDLYGKIGAEISKVYIQDLDVFFKRSRKSIENDDTKILCDAISDQSILEPKVDEVKIIKNTGTITIHVRIINV